MHVAFMAVPAHGHVNPSLALIAELVRRGHRVTFPVGAEFADAVRGAGAEPFVHQTSFPSTADGEVDWPEDDLAAAQRLFLDELISVTPLIEARYQGDRPDVVVYDIGGWQGPILAAKWGVPAIQLSPTFVAYPGMEEDFGLDPAAPDPALAAVYADFDAFIAAQGVDLSREEIMYRPRRCVVTITREWQLKGDLVGDHYTFVGPSVTERAGDYTPPDGADVVLVSLGSAYTHRPEFYRECVEAFTGLPFHVLLSVGRTIDPVALGDVPDNIEVVNWVPQVGVLAVAKAFVTHAGMGSTMEALYFGVPTVAVPQAVDQMLNGPRLAELGLGAHVPKEEATAGNLRAALLRVTSDPEIAANLRRVSAATRAAGGAVAAADIVERAGATGRV